MKSKTFDNDKSKRSTFDLTKVSYKFIRTSDHSLFLGLSKLNLVSRIYSILFFVFDKTQIMIQI